MIVKLERASLVHHGRIGDVQVYRNTNFPRKEDANWQWYAAVPTANIKAYRLAEGPKPSVQPKAETQEPTRPGPQARA